MQNVYMVQRQHQKCSTSCNFSYDGDKFWVYGAKIRIVRVSRDFYIVIASLSFEWHSIHMSKFGASDSPKPQLKIAHIFCVKKLKTQSAK